MSWQTIEGINYRAQGSTDLECWENLGGLERGTGNLLKYDHPATNAQSSFG